VVERVGRYDSTLEENVLGRLRSRYQELGYEFAVHPAADSLPEFMRGYVPDAVAVRGNDHIAIEVRGSLQDSEQIAKIARKFEGQPGWRFTVSFSGDDPLLSVPVPKDQIEGIRAQATTIEKMVVDGYVSAALIMAFALLEATERLTQEAPSSPPLKPGTVVQSLEMEGLIDPEIAARLRSLILRRNEIVHGHSSAPVEPNDVRTVLSAVETALTAAFEG